MCINLNTQAVLMETKVLLTYFSTSQSQLSCLLSLVVLPAKEDAGDVILQMQLSQRGSDGYVNWGENLAYQEVLKPIGG